MSGVDGFSFDGLPDACSLFPFSAGFVSFPVALLSGFVFSVPFTEFSYGFDIMAAAASVTAFVFTDAVGSTPGARVALASAWYCT